MNRKKIMISIIVFMLSCIVFGYAYLSNNLSINGYATINNSVWDIHYENIFILDDETSVTCDTPTLINDTSLNFTVSLDKPGDIFAFTVDVVNAGSIDGMIQLINKTVLDDEMLKYINYEIKYANNKEYKVKDLLEVGHSQKLYIKVEYIKDLNKEDLPITNKEININISTTYVEADSTAVPVDLAMIKSGSYSNSIFGSRVDKVNNIYFLNEINIPEDAIEVTDISVEGNGLVWSYYLTNPENPSNYNLYIAANGNVYGNYNSSYLFSKFYSLESINNMEYFNTKFITNMNFMFLRTMNGVENATLDIDFSNADLNNVSSIKYMFSEMCTNSDNCNINIKGNFINAKNLEGIFSLFAGKVTGNVVIDISNFRTPNSENLKYAFENIGKLAFSVNIIGLKDFDTSKVTNMECTFSDGYVAGAEFTQKIRTNTYYNISDVSYWDVSNVESMFKMFKDVIFPENTVLDFSTWNTSKLLDASSMFGGGSYFDNCDTFNLTINNFKFLNNIDISHMFYMSGIKNVNLKLNNWDTSNVVNMQYTFASSEVESFIVIGIDNWDTSKVTDMSNMFTKDIYNNVFDVGDLSNWDTSKVTNMSNMFASAGYNAINRVNPNVSSWNVNLVTNYTNFNNNSSWITPPTWIN